MLYIKKICFIQPKTKNYRFHEKGGNYERLKQSIFYKLNRIQLLYNTKLTYLLPTSTREYQRTVKKNLTERTLQDLTEDSTEMLLVKTPRLKATSMSPRSPGPLAHKGH